ncbi:MAG: DUF1048 domain-containing protein [Clostridium sp.]|jgi:DNA-binding ferritin-like protein (Dps family)|nr:DUF1048 domain-containing protein [Clostridium sp.]
MANFIKQMIEDKKEHKEHMARVAALPEEYQFVFQKMQWYMWSFAVGTGHDMMKIQDDLIELFEASAADGKHVLDVTGEDAVAFCDELLRDAKKWSDSYRKKLNRDIAKKFKKGDDSP